MLAETTDEDVKNDACNKEDEYIKASEADQAECEEAWQCDVDQVKHMLDGSFCTTSNQVREELRSGADVLAARKAAGEATQDLNPGLSTCTPISWVCAAASFY